MTFKLGYDNAQWFAVINGLLEVDYASDGGRVNPVVRENIVFGEKVGGIKVADIAIEVSAEDFGGIFKVVIDQGNGKIADPAL
jgi:hypothetical protein